MALFDLFFGGERFEAKLRRAADQLGLELFISDDGQGGGFAVLFDGATYLATAILRGDRVIVTVSSNVRFPLRRLPAAVTRALVKRNDDLPRADWTDVHGDARSYYALVAQGRLAAFNAEMLRAALREMVPEVATVDRALEDDGYVR